MQGMEKVTNQDYVKTMSKGDGPALNRPALVGSGGQTPSYEDAAKICETLTDKEIDMLLVANNPLGWICLDMEIIDETLEEQSEEDERIEEEIEASIRESIEAEEEIEEEIRASIEESEKMLREEEESVEGW